MIIIIIKKYIIEESNDKHRDKYELLTISNTDFANKSNIIFNGNKCEACGHYISAIHYNNEQYIYMILKII